MQNPDQPQYRLAVVAEMVEVHPDTIRRYERQGLIRSHKQQGERLYTERALRRVQRIVSVTRLGVNLSGADVVCNLLERLELMEAEMEALRQQVRDFLED